MTETIDVAPALKKVLIATPAFNGQVHMTYMSSVVQVIMQAHGRGFDITLYTLSDSLITRARNNVVATFLDGDWDRLFWIDSDIGFEPDQFFRVLEADRDVSAAAYPLKMFHLPTVSSKLAGRDLEASMMRYALTLPSGQITIPEDGFIEVPEVATGFMCIKRDVLTAMVETFPHLKYTSDQGGLGAPKSDNHYLFFDTMVDGDRYLSEDYAFCRRVQLMNRKVWVDLRSELTHTGPVSFRGSIPETSRVNS